MLLVQYDFALSRWKGTYTENGIGPLIEGMKAAKSRRVGNDRVVDLSGNNINNSTKNKVETMFSKELVKV
jgi:hypothetical protein